jgi:hypothetical protein
MRSLHSCAAVICVAVAAGRPPVVYDLDSLLAFPCPAEHYVICSFEPDEPIQERYRQ